MKSFAQRGRPNSPQTSRPGTATRSEIAANAKVNRADLKTQSHQQQHAPAHGQNNGRRIPRGPSKQQNVRVDQWDTDAESIDTTVAPVPPPGHPQDGHHFHSQQNQDPTQYDEEGYDEDDGSEDELGQEYQQDDNPQYHDQQVGSHVPPEIRDQVWDLNERAGIHIEGDSYPTTTSGINEDTLMSQHNGDQDQASDDLDNLSHVSPSPQRPVVKGQMHRPLAQQPSPRPSSAIGLARPTQGNRDLYQQGATNGDRSIQKFSTQPSHLPQRTLSDPRLGQLPSHSQGMPPVNIYAPKDTSVSQMNHKQSMQGPPQRGPGARSRGFLSAVPSNPLPPVQPKPAAARQPVIYPTPHVHPTEVNVGQIDRPASPTEDYDVPALYHMDYNELKTEDFDTDPRRPDPVLSEDMLSKTLEERLRYVQKSLDAGDQAKFFRSLPTSEWEDAGDWFLHQFEGIIKRTRETRQEKRKLAREFEKEVEKRHRHVDKRSRQVDEAMQKMSAHGQGLLPPKSPARP